MNGESERPPSENEADDGVVQATYDWSSVAPSTAVVETVAIAVDRELTALDSLYESIDPDALDTLVRSNRSSTDDRPTTISFSFAGRRVTVRSTGDVFVRAETSLP